ncbi:hypothetical protein PENSPDRAFT_749178 [Peniophora sp. CONT]|nr:hypothetical protein PENSPDRAFT_749178 [Peniophora sp. CONT]
MAVPHRFAVRSYGHLSHLVNQAVEMDGSPEARFMANIMVYQLTAAIWQMALPRPHGMHGSLLERRLADNRTFELAYVGNRLLARPELCIYRIIVRTARTYQGQFLDFNPAYEKVLLVATNEYLAAFPRPRPDLPIFPPPVEEMVRQFTRTHCDPYRHWDRVHPDFHTHFFHTDTPAVCVAPPSQALNTYVEQHEDDFSGPLHQAAIEAYAARLESEDDDVFDLLAYINQDAEARDIDDIFPEDIIGAYLTQRYFTVNTVHFQPAMLDPAFAKWYHPIPDTDEEVANDNWEMPDYYVDEDAMLPGGGGLEVVVEETEEEAGSDMDAFINGTQNVVPRVAEYGQPLLWSQETDEENPWGWIQSLSSNSAAQYSFATLSLVDAISRYFTGQVSIVGRGPPQITALHTRILDSAVFTFTASNNPNTFSIAPSSAMNKSVSEALQDLSAHVVASLMSDEANLSIHAPVMATVLPDKNIYDYRPSRLWLVYGVAIALAIVANFLGLACMHWNGVAMQRTFSAIAASVRAHELDDLLSGPEEAPRSAAKVAKLRYRGGSSQQGGRSGFRIMEGGDAVHMAEVAKLNDADVQSP